MFAFREFITICMIHMYDTYVLYICILLGGKKDLFLGRFLHKKSVLLKQHPTMSSPSPPESPSSKLSFIKSAVLTSDYSLCNIKNEINELKSDVKIIQNYLENINSTLDTLTQSTNSDHQEENKLDQILQSIQQLNATIPGPEPCGAYKVYELLNEGDVIPHKTECDNYITGRIFRKTLKYIEYYTDPVPNKRNRNILRRGDKAIITDKENPLCNNIITVKRNENTKIYCLSSIIVWYIFTYFYVFFYYIFSLSHLLVS